MPGRIGPLVTTGVALSVAAVIVANPVVAPRPDLQVPAVQLSGTGDTMDMLNTDFLSAIGPAPTESTSNPFAVLKELVASLAADATYLGRNAIVAAFFAGATAVAHPELTAASHPYLPAPVPLLPADWLTRLAVDPVAVPAAPDLIAAAAIPAELIPAAAEVIVALVDDFADLGEGAVTTAFAAGALLVSGGVQVVQTLHDIVGDPVRALQSAVNAVVVELPKTVAEVVQRIIELVAPGHQLNPRGAESPAVDAPAAGSPALVVPPASSAEVVSARSTERREPAFVAPAVRPTRDLPKATREVSSRTDVPADLPVEASAPEPDGVEPEVRAPVGALRIPQPVRPGPLGAVLNDVRAQTKGAFGKAVDSVRKAAERAAGPVAGPAGD